MIKLIFFCSVILHLVLTSLALLSVWPPLTTLLVVLVDMLWIVSLLKEWKNLTTLFLIVVFSLAVIGLAQGAGAVQIILGYLCGILAWDLDKFQRYLSSADSISNKTYIMKRHLVRLAGVIIVSLILCQASFQLNLQLNLYVVIAMICGLLMMRIEKKS